MLCDGTWNTYDNSKGLTNIAKMGRFLLDDPQKQVVFYNNGVGTEVGKVKQIVQGAVGAGIQSHIKACYKAICENYISGDRIFIFGFSRGGATARAIACMISNVGLLPKGKTSKKKIDEAFSVYVKEPGADMAKDAKAQAFFKKNGCIEVKIHFLGVFDAVPALGLPGEWDNTLFFKNIDMILTNKIVTARHALALDEKRNEFRPDVWTPLEGVDSQQRWFVGSHADVGGFYHRHGLSDISLKWILNEAKIKGLIVPDDYDRDVSGTPAKDASESEDEDNMDEFVKAQLSFAPNWNACLHNSKTGFYKLTPTYLRPTLKVSDEGVDDSVVHRIMDQDEYDPVNLMKDHSKVVNDRITELGGSIRTKKRKLAESS